MAASIAPISAPVWPPETILVMGTGTRSHYAPNTVFTRTAIFTTSFTLATT